MDKTWNVFVDGCGLFKNGTDEATARARYSALVRSGIEETVELVHDEQTQQRYN